MLSNDFFSVTQRQSGQGNIRAVIDFQKEHPIFMGHFPGNPVVPGVCMIQIVKEILEQEENTSLRLAAADNVKFLAVINPRKTARVRVVIHYSKEDHDYQTKATLTDAAITYFKFSGKFIVNRD